MTPSLQILTTTLAALTLSAALEADNHEIDPRLADIVVGDHRPADWIERNDARNPAETLSFFGLRPDMTVIELSPGGGWYTSVIAPYLKDDGQYVAAHWDMEQDDLPEYAVRGFAAFTERFGDSSVYGDIEIIPFNPPSKSQLGEANSADMVLSFRNVHGWTRDGLLDDMFESAHAVLKRGGVLGIVGHRLPGDREGEGTPGYLKRSFIVGMAESHGFRLAEASEINANPADTADHPSGVWSLPPSLRDGEETAEKYLAIGESDRFTLKFVKR
jgi:predicted methyltransferase